MSLDVPNATVLAVATPDPSETSVAVWLSSWTIRDAFKKYKYARYLGTQLRENIGFSDANSNEC